MSTRRLSPARFDAAQKRESAKAQLDRGALSCALSALTLVGRPYSALAPPVLASVTSTLTPGPIVDEMTMVLT